MVLIKYKQFGNDLEFLWVATAFFRLELEKNQEISTQLKKYFE